MPCFFQRLVDVEYYHLPIVLPPDLPSHPLSGLVLAISSYSGYERTFLEFLSVQLGAWWDKLLGMVR